jgi:hypothetical protein
VVEVAVDDKHLVFYTCDRLEDARKLSMQIRSYLHFELIFDTAFQLDFGLIKKDSEVMIAGSKAMAHYAEREIRVFGDKDGMLPSGCHQYLDIDIFD